MQNSYIYRDKYGLVNLNTLSPSKLYYYKIQRPKALNPSAFGTRIAFYDVENKLLYHHDNTYAHEIHKSEEMNSDSHFDSLLKGSVNTHKTESLEFVHWSFQGNTAYFLEYSTHENETLYESVIAFLKDNESYRINENNNAFDLVSKLKLLTDGFDEVAVRSFMETSGLESKPLLLDSLKKGTFSTKWHPNT